MARENAEESIVSQAIEETDRLLHHHEAIDLVGADAADNAVLVRYNERGAVERINGRIKDDFGGRDTRVRGDKKVMCHLMFGILALTVDQLMKFVT